ncbi:MAG: CoA pyrophosphatase [candidate division KSB1 bacterium]|nr:CoA pyrophosphatase [candidate division KSB1 bacterium]
MNNRDLKHLSQALPACPDVMAREKYYNSAVLVPFVFLENEYHFLFQRRTPHIRQGKEICFPGGRFEADLDSDARDTAIRETMEELGVGREKIKIMGRLDTLVAPMGAVIDPFVATLEIDSLDELIRRICG